LDEVEWVRGGANERIQNLPILFMIEVEKVAVKVEILI
jgi:hypothetical protein